jgi:hypothetical protein
MIERQGSTPVRGAAIAAWVTTTSEIAPGTSSRSDRELQYLDRDGHLDVIATSGSNLATLLFSAR